MFLGHVAGIPDESRSRKLGRSQASDPLQNSRLSQAPDLLQTSRLSQAPDLLRLPQKPDSLQASPLSRRPDLSQSSRLFQRTDNYLRSVANARVGVNARLEKRVNNMERSKLASEDAGEEGCEDADPANPHKEEWVAATGKSPSGRTGEPLERRKSDIAVNKETASAEDLDNLEEALMEIGKRLRGIDEDFQLELKKEREENMLLKVELENCEKSQERRLEQQRVQQQEHFEKVLKWQEGELQNSQEKRLSLCEKRNRILTKELKKIRLREESIMKDCRESLSMS